MAAVTTLIRHLLLRRLRVFGRAIRLGIGLLCRLRRRNGCGRFRLRRRRLYPLIPRRQTRGFIESRGFGPAHLCCEQARFLAVSLRPLCRLN